MTTEAVTDPALREEMIETVRRWVANEVIPVASTMEHADEYPESLGQSASTEKMTAAPTDADAGTLTVVPLLGLACPPDWRLVVSPVKCTPADDDDQSPESVMVALPFAAARFVSVLVAS